MTAYNGPTMPGMPRKHYGTIYADPAWGFRTRQKKMLVPQRTEVQHYPTMTLEEMKALPVGEVAAKDCVLHLWTISSHVHHCMELAAHWGFEYKSLGIIWVKTQKGNPEVPKMSMGFWFRQEGEISLLFTKGSPARLDKGVRQVIMEPAREHSRKPDDGIERVERLSEGPYLEMFSRSYRAGWDSWGNETEKFDTPEMQRDVESLV